MKPKRSYNILWRAVQTVQCFKKQQGSATATFASYAFASATFASYASASHFKIQFLTNLNLPHPPIRKRLITGPFQSPAKKTHFSIECKVRFWKTSKSDEKLTKDVLCSIVIESVLFCLLVCQMTLTERKTNGLSWRYERIPWPFRLPLPCPVPQQSPNLMQYWQKMQFYLALRGIWLLPPEHISCLEHKFPKNFCWIAPYEEMFT